jgi:hypothetical protein
MPRRIKKNKSEKRKSTKKKIKHTNHNHNNNKINIQLQAGGGGGGGGAGGSGSSSSSFSFPLPYQNVVSQFTPLHQDEKVPSLLQRVMQLEQNTVSNSTRNDHSAGQTIGSIFRDSNSTSGGNILAFEDPTQKDFNGTVSHSHPLFGDGVETQLSNDFLFNNNDRETDYYDADAKKYTHYKRSDNLSNFHTPMLNRINKIYDNDIDEEEEIHFNNPALSTIKELNNHHKHPIETNENEKHLVHNNLLEQFDEAAKKKRGRPIGAKNKPKIYAEPVHSGFAVGMPILQRSKSDGNESHETHFL